MVVNPRLRELFDAEHLLTPTEVAELFAVNPKTVTRWAKKGLLPCFRTIGGHRRYRESDIRAVYERQYGVEPGFINL